MRTFAIGDIHGQSKLLERVLANSPFDAQNDLLIILGDIVDWGHNPKACIEQLLGIKNKVFVLGNHDIYFQHWLDKPGMHLTYRIRGGRATIRSYGGARIDVPQRHRDFFKTGKPYHLESNKLFVHGGFDPRKELVHQSIQRLTMDRQLIKHAKKEPIRQFEHVFIGHTPTHMLRLRCHKPLTFNNLTMLDTGCGYGGKLTLMDIETREYWQA